MDAFAEDEADYSNVEWREVADEDVPLVLREMATSGPQSIYILNLIKGCLKWSSKCRETKTKVYCPSDSRWKNSVMVTLKGKIYAVAIFSPCKNYSFLKSALRRNYIVDWERGPMVFLGMPQEIFAPLERSTTSMGVQMEWSYTFHSYWLPSKKAEEFQTDIPDDVTISSLDQRHAIAVNSVWPYASQESYDLVADMLHVNESVGLFRKEDSALVSWILYTYYGLGMMHTKAEFRNKGYGATIVKAITKRLSNEVQEITLLAKEDNITANRLFQRLGFQKSGLVRVFQVARQPVKIDYGVIKELVERKLEVPFGALRRGNQGKDEEERMMGANFDRKRLVRD